MRGLVYLFFFYNMNIGELCSGRYKTETSARAWCLLGNLSILLTRSPLLVKKKMDLIYEQV